MRKFVLTLARHNGWSPRMVLDAYDSVEISEQIAFSQDHPFPDIYWCAAMLATVVWNLWSKSKRKLESFLPAKPEKPKQSMSAMKAIMDVVTSRSQRIKK